jgi:hypothetical protein
MGIPDVEGAEEIGRGGFGVVYKAHQSRFDRTIAVKVLEQAQLDENGRQRFERECKALGALSGHPNVVTIYDSGFTPNAGWPFLVLEYLPDGSLGDRVDRDGPIDIDQATELIVKICGALETAHRIGVLHRDLKPENILMGPYDEPKLGDFGIARVQGATMTATSTIWGSPAHAAPEIIEGKGATPQTDIYSLGSTLYVLLSGRLAFQRDTDESIIPVLARIATEAPPDLRPIGVPDAVWAVVDKAMAKDPAHRQQTAMDVGRELQAARAAIGLPAVEMRVKGEPVRRGGTTGLLAGTQAPSSTATLSGGAAPAAAATVTPPPATSYPTPTPTPNPTPAPTGYGVPTATPPPGAPVGTYTPPPGSVPPGYGPPPGYYSGPVVSPTGPTGPSSSGSSKTWLIALVAFVVVVVIAAGIFVATRSSGQSATSTTTTTQGTPSNPVDSESATTDSESSGTNPEVDLTNAVLTASSIPGSSWTVSPDASSFNGFSFLEPCNKPVDATSLTQQEKTELTGKTPSGKAGGIFQAVGQFDSEDDAKAFLDALPDEISCHTWTDNTGEDHDIIGQDLQHPVGDQSLLFEDIVTSSGTKYDHDIAFYREGAYVGFVTNLTLDPNDESFTEQLLKLADDQLKSTIG